MNHSPERRKSLSLIGAAMVGGWCHGSAAAQQATPPSSNGGKPFDLIPTPITADANRVRFLFAYDCPHCRSYHNGLTQWGASLPKRFKFDATPVITNVDTQNQPLAVYGHLVAKQMDPTKVHLYDYAMYAQLQGDADAGISPKSILTIEDVLRTLVNVGIDGRAIQKFIQTKGVGLENRITEHGLLVKTYGMHVTPSVALVGRYVVNPDHANSNPQQFLLLLNGLVSRIMQGGNNAL